MISPWWSNPTATALGGILTGGIFTGLLGDDLKRRLQEWRQRREARRRLYDDLGAYLGRVEALSLLTELDLLLWNEVINPQAPHFDYYSAHEPGVLLRADTNRGVQLLMERLRALGAAYRTLSDDGSLNQRALAKSCKARPGTRLRMTDPLLLRAAGFDFSHPSVNTR